MRSVELTEATIKSLTSTDPRGTRFTDGSTRGFGVTAYPDGRRVFFLRYGVRDRRRFVTIGQHSSKLTVKAARSRAEDILAAYRLDGKDPALERRKRAAVPIFRVWVDEYLKERMRTHKAAKRDRAYLLEACEFFGPTTLDEITTAKVKAARLAVSARGEVTGNRFLGALRACFKAAMAEDIIQRNPAQWVALTPERHRRVRVISDAELKALVKAADAHPDPWVRAVVLIAIGTGARHGEIIGARWDDLDFDTATWRLPETKTGGPQQITLAPGVLEVFRTLPRLMSSPWLFPGVNPAKHRSDIKNGWNAIRKTAACTDVHFHDLRKAFAERVRRVADLQTASAALRHSDISVTASSYAPANAEAVRAAVDLAVGQVIPFAKQCG